jgi:hypothetical protein
MSDALETSTLVDTQLEIIMNELECDRVWIAQFHNGGYFYPTGRQFRNFLYFMKNVLLILQIFKVHFKIFLYLYSLEYFLKYIKTMNCMFMM